MPEAVVTALVQFGMLGPIVALMAWYIVRRDTRHDTYVDSTREELRLVRTEFKDTQDKRVADMKEIAEKVLSGAERTNDVLSELAGAIREQRVLLERITPRS